MSLLNIAATLWAGVFGALLLWSTILNAEMKRNRIRTEWPMWEMRSGAFTTDPAELTEVGKVYRQKALVAELLLFAWGAIGIIGFSIISRFSN